MEHFSVFSSAQVKTSYAIQVEYYTYEDVLYILSFYVWITVT